MRIGILALVGLLLSVPGSSFGQATGEDAGPTFEVASIRLNSISDFLASGSMRPRFRGGPGTSDPGRLRVAPTGLRTLIEWAWNVQDFALATPRGVEDVIYSIDAVVPPNTSRQDCYRMLQHLLIERLKLEVHHEARMGTIYELVVAKDGSKLRDAEPPPAGEPAGLEPTMRPNLSLSTVRGKDGRPQLPPGRPGAIRITMVGSGFRFLGRMQTGADIASTLENHIGHPVIDKTGLKGVYDYTFDVAADGPVQINSPAAPAETDIGDILGAVVRQLGLKLERKKGPVDVLVVDRFSKTPTEN
ncbi:MAG: TIGR03435 family protein [Bryobacteraceae bacterium]